MKQSKKFNLIIFLYAIVVVGFLYELIDINVGFKYLDEILIVVLLFRWLSITKGVVKREIFLFFLIMLFFLCMSLIEHNNVVSAIIMDFIIQSKPYLTFYSLAFLPFMLSSKHCHLVKKCCILLAVACAPVGLMYVVGNDKPIYMLFGHPARFATMYEFLGVSFLLFSKKTKRDVLISIAIIGIGFMSLRSKIFAFGVIYSGVMLLDKSINYRHYFTVKNIVVISTIMSMALYLAWGKIQYYFIIGQDTTSEYTMFARAQLYYSSIDVIRDNPLWGTGFGSYASEASAKYYSPIYAKYNLDLNPEINKGLYLSDTYFPCLVGQFGIIGIFIFIAFWYRRVKTANEYYKRTNDIFLLKYTLLLLLFFFIESAVDSTLTNNRGVLMMMCLGIAHGNKIHG